APAVTAGGPYAGASGAAIAFNGSATDADNDPLTYTWSFGDGASGSGASPSHVYTTPGTYSATFTASHGRLTASAVPTVVVSQANRAPVAKAGGPYTGDSGAPLALSGAASSDPDGDVLTFAWDFGDGSNGSGPVAIHTYASTGSFTVNLTVTDNH